MRTLTIVVLLAGCGPTDTDAGTDTDTDTDGAEGITIEARLPVDVQAGWRAAARIAHYDEGPVFGDEHASAAMTSSTVTLEVPAVDDIGPIHDGTGALFLIYAYEDADADGLHGADELVVGASRAMLVYEAGVGWTGVASPPDAGGAPAYDPAAGFDLIPFGGGATVGGTLAPELSEAATRLAAVAWNEGALDPLQPGRPVDQALTDPWSAAFAGDLAEERTFTSESGGVYGIEALVAYADDDGDGALGRDDRQLGKACVGVDRQAALLWVAPATTADEVWSALAEEGPATPGWHVVSVDEGFRELTDAEAGALEIRQGVTCAE